VVKFIGCQLFILKFHIIYILPCTYQKISKTSPLISESRCDLRSCLLTSYFVSCPQLHVIKTLLLCSHTCTHTLALALTYSHSRPCLHVLALALTYLPSHLRSRSCNCVISLMFTCLLFITITHCVPCKIQLLSHPTYYRKGYSPTCTP
jgi:hypothetical protein